VGHGSAVGSVAISPDGRQALSGSYDRTLKLWDLETGELLQTLAGHEDGVAAVSVAPDGRSALSGSSDQTLRLWDLRSGQQIRQFHRMISSSDLRGFQELAILLSHSHWINAVAITSDGRFALSGSHDRTLKLWDLQTGQLIRSFIGHTDTVYA